MKNPAFISEELHDRYVHMFVGHEDAFDFLKLSNAYFEIVDDLIDEPKNLDKIKRCTALAGLFYNHTYWIKHRTTLWIVERLIRCQYLDSVKWEHSDEEWMKRDAKALSHSAVNLVFTVILIEFGQDVLDNFSAEFRENAHRLHINDL
jgi:hypothetical protein